MDVVLREWAVEDAPALSRAIEASLEHLRPWAPWAADEPQTLEQRRTWIRDAHAGRGDRVFGAWRAGEVVGGCGLHARIGERGLEIGYWVHAAFVGRGIATAMATRLVAIAFADPGIDHVEIHHDPANLASARVPEKLGFTRTAGLDAQGHVVWRLRRRPAADRAP